VQKNDIRLNYRSKATASEEDGLYVKYMNDGKGKKIKEISGL